MTTTSWRSQWLYLLLKDHYPVRSYMRSELTVSKTHGVAFRRYWTRQSKGGDTDYELAPLHVGLTSGEVATIEGLRSGLFQLKLDIVELLLESVSGKNSVAVLWAKVVNAMSEHLLASELDFLLDIDCRQPTRGNLSDLIKLIGHCEEELSVGLYRKTHSALKSLVATQIAETGHFTVDFDDANEVEKRDVLEHGISVFEALRPDEKKYWRQFWVRWEQTINSSFSHEIVIRRKVKRLHTRNASVLLDSFADFALNYLSMTGKMPEVKDSEFDYTFGDKVQGFFFDPHSR